MTARRKTRLRLDAVCLTQQKTKKLFLFGLTGSELLTVAEVSRVHRDDIGELVGYQRLEVKRHVQDIVEYLNGEQVLFPNSIILAISPKAKFYPMKGQSQRAIMPGLLEIPVPRPEEPKPAWIVDGQQRVLAICKSLKKELPIPVSAFITDDLELQRDQFLRVNNTRPLPRGLINELLPVVSATLPARLEARKVPSGICDLLHRDPDSPFHRLIVRASSPVSDRRSEVVADTSVVRMIMDSLSSPSGCLFPYNNMATQEVDISGVRAVLFAYWKAVKNVFPLAWGKSPAESRLMHGAGIRSMGRLMDKIMSTLRAEEESVIQNIEQELRLVEPICRWTGGRWEGLGDLAWNEVQNVPRHVRALSDLLMRSYLQAKYKA